MKTALTELIEKWERMNLISKHTRDAEIVSAFINSAKLLLEKEKQQIIDAYQEGVVHGNEYFPGDDSFAQKYFNQTFLSNENANS